jgi:hypothetical protein
MRRREFLRLGAVAAAGAGVLGVAHSVRNAAGKPGRGDLRVISGTVRLRRHTVGVGRTLRFDPAVNTTLVLSGNLIVRGTLEMRPRRGVTHTIRFVGIDESKFVGGGMEVLDSDVGLWVMGKGRLDILGEPRAGWNRTGTDETWRRNDEVLTTPFLAGDVSTFAPFSGTLAETSAPDGTVVTQEAFNLTRSVRIEGTPGGRTHIFINSSARQSIRYAAIRHVGPRRADGDHFVPGRYGLHFHMCGRGSVGSTVRGVVVRDCGSHAFVPHLSDGVTFADCIAYGVNEDAYWWDDPDRSNHIQYRHCMVAKLIPIPSNRGYRLAGFNLGLGTGLVAHDCVVAGNLGNTAASGFKWPRQTNSKSGLVWSMTNCVAHNNKWAGIYFWHNCTSPHTVTDFTSFHNRIGIEHGSYWNLLHVDRLLTFSNNIGLVLHSLSAGAPSDRLAYRDARMYDGMAVANHKVPTTGVAILSDSIVSHVWVEEARGAPAEYDFVNCTKDGSTSLEPADFTVRDMLPDSVYRVQRGDGTAYQVNPNGTSSDIPSFA